MAAALFLGFLALTAMFVIALIARFLNGRTAFRVLAGLCVWFAYVGLLGYSGLARNAEMRPPGATLIILPVFVFIVLFAIKTPSGAAMAFPV
ncbi:MAG: hypothetical protein ABI822_02750 [Bryobacteraceae bacterium]